MRQTVLFKHALAGNHLSWAPRMRLRFGYQSPDDAYEHLLLQTVTPTTRWLDNRCGAHLCSSDRGDASHAIAHNKVILIDDGTVIPGSVSFSKVAEESNAENVLIVRDYPAIFASYSSNFAAHEQHGQPYVGLTQMGS